MGGTKRARWRATSVVQELEARRDVAHDAARLVLAEHHVALQAAEQRAAAHLLEDQAELVVLLKVLHQLHDVRVAGAQVEQLDLLDDAHAAVAGPLLDDLHKRA